MCFCFVNVCVWMHVYADINVRTYVLCVNICMVRILSDHVANIPYTLWSKLYDNVKDMSSM
jgi:hypothetical protein